MLNIFFQDGAQEVLEGLETEATEKTLSIMELLMKGGVGGQIIIGVLLCLPGSRLRVKGFIS